MQLSFKIHFSLNAYIFTNSGWNVLKNKYYNYFDYVYEWNHTKKFCINVKLHIHRKKHIDQSIQDKGKWMKNYSVYSPGINWSDVFILHDVKGIKSIILDYHN